MKKLVFMLFVLFGVISYSAMDKVIIIVNNDDYSQSLVTGTVSRGGLANLIFGGIKDNNVDEDVYMLSGKAEKATFIIEKNEESTLIKVLKYFEKQKYSGIIEVIEISSSENKKIREITDKNGWVYEVYPSTSLIKGNVKLGDSEMPKGEIINGFLTEVKKNLKK